MVLDPSKNVGQLTQTEGAALCDEVNSLQGGYGRAVSCPDAAQQQTDPSQAMCIRGLQAFGIVCGLTVGEAIGCAMAIGTDLCRVTTAAECSAISTCM